MKFLSVTCAIGLLLLGTLTNALPNPAALPDALVEGDLEVVARDAGADEAGAQLSARMHGFCWRGWDQINYQGNSEEACCFQSCCYIEYALLRDRLFSAKSTGSSSGGVRLWTNEGCTGQSRWVDPEGWYDLAKAPTYLSYNN